MEKLKKNKRGITLVALVVTIVILLILAGISLNLVLGNNGIIKKAGDAVNAYKEDERNTQIALDSLYNEIISQTEGSGGGSLPSNDETTPYLPTGFSKVPATNLDTGLVIQDGSGNQYVWVEVPKSLYNDSRYNTKDTTADKKPSSSTDYDNIEYCLQKYTSIYRNGTSFTDTYYADSDNEGWFADETEYNTAKQKMLKSVYENGGFYVGRYETGIENSYRTVDGDATETPVIKANAYPYTYVTRTQAKVLAESMESGDRTSSLMFGVQWDLVLAFMHNKGGVADSTLTSDSSTIGNYYNSSLNITNTLAKYSSNNGASWSDCPLDKHIIALLTTGADASFGIMNIYDIAGNVGEWTLELSSDSSYPCASRGGNFAFYVGDDCPASYHLASRATYSDYVVSFRVSLY